MKFPIVGLSNGNPNTGAVNYFSVVGSFSPYTAAESDFQIPLTEELTVTEFGARLTTAPGSEKSRAITLRKNGADTAASLTFSGESTEATPWTGSVVYSAGDFINLATTPTGTPTAPGNISTYLIASTASESFLIFGGTTSTADTASTGYANANGTSTAAWETATEALVRIVVPLAGTFTKARFKTSPAPSAGKKYEFSPRLNGATDFLTCSIADAATTSSLATGSQAIAPNDTLTVKCVPTGTPTAARVGWCLSCTPTTPGESFVGFGSSIADSTTLVAYHTNIGQAGTNGWSATESARYRYGPATTARKVYVQIGTAPGGGKSRTYTLRNNGADTAAKVKIEGEATSGNYAGGDVSIAAGTISLQSTPAGTPAADTGGVHTGVLFFTAQEEDGPVPGSRSLLGVGR